MQNQSLFFPSIVFHIPPYPKFQCPSSVCIPSNSSLSSSPWVIPPRDIVCLKCLTSLLNQHLAMSRTRLRSMFHQGFEDIILLSSGLWCCRQEVCCQPNCSSFPDNLTFLAGCFRDCPCPLPVSPYVPRCGFIFIFIFCSDSMGCRPRLATTSTSSSSLKYL